MKKRLFTIYVRGELQPYQVYAHNIRDAILILTGKLISMGYCSEIECVSYSDNYKYLSCEKNYKNINIKVTYEETY